MPLTAAQIVTNACQIAKCPGFTAQGGQALNFVLNDLVRHRNLKINIVSAAIAVSAGSVGPYNLEADYLRTYLLYYLVNGEPVFLDPASRVEFDADNSTAVGNGYPREWATDLSPVASGGVGLLYIFPPSNGSLSLTHRYFVNRPDITMPETSSTVPWFEDQDYLLTATALRLMRITDDSRYDKFETDCENMLRLHLLQEGDEQQVVKEVKLDPRRFRVANGNRPTKQSPF